MGTSRCPGCTTGERKNNVFGISCFWFKLPFNSWQACQCPGCTTGGRGLICPALALEKLLESCSTAPFEYWLLYLWLLPGALLTWFLPSSNCLDDSRFVSQHRGLKGGRMRKSLRQEVRSKSKGGGAPGRAETKASLGDGDQDDLDDEDDDDHLAGSSCWRWNNVTSNIRLPCLANGAATSISRSTSARRRTARRRRSRGASWWRSSWIGRDGSELPLRVGQEELGHHLKNNLETSSMWQKTLVWQQKVFLAQWSWEDPRRTCGDNENLNEKCFDIWEDF